ncbi:hypothetical protein N665_2638s0001 [Sinapis alba]|nr:hypothetical protein N665_2638s0001 [Sinapis alba]
MINRVETQDSEKQLVMRFVGGLRQQIQFTLNLFRPQLISEAHQHALTIEAQTRAGFQTWGTGRQTHPNTAAASATPTDNTTAKTETAIVPIDPQKQNRPGGFRCYSCGETGHRQSACPNRARRGLLLEDQNSDEPIYDEDDQYDTEELVDDSGPLLMLRRSCLAPHITPDNPQQNNLFHSKCTINGKVCSFIVDSGSSENVISSDAVKKLSLPEETHPTPYKLAWLQQHNDLFVTKTNNGILLHR